MFALDVPTDGATFHLSIRQPGQCSLILHTDEKGAVYEEKITDCTAETTNDTPLVAWAPPGIDRGPPPVLADVPCPLPQVLEAASRRARDLEDNLQKFTARDQIEDQEIGKNGKRRHSISSAFSYVAEVHESDQGGAYIQPLIRGWPIAAPPHSRYFFFLTIWKSFP